MVHTVMVKSFLTGVYFDQLLLLLTHTDVLKSLHTPSLNCIFSCFENEQIDKWASQPQEQILRVLLSISK